jgi:hypothetical protein
VWSSVLAPLKRKNWFVYAKPPFSGPEAVLAYLGRYTHRVAIANSRLVALDERGVTFRYKDYRRDGWARYRTMTLSADEFIRRFLLHVLPKGFHRIRHYGLLASAGCKANIARAKKLMAAPAPAVDPPAGRDTADPHTTTIIARRAHAAAAAWSLSRSLHAAPHRAAHPPLPGSGFDAMTIPVLSWRHPFTGTFRSRRANFIPAPTSAGKAPRTSRQSGHRARQQWSIRNHQRLSALGDLAKTCPRQSRSRANSP